MGSPSLAAPLLLLLLLLIGLSASAGIGCPYLPRWSTHCLLASHMEDTLTGRSAHIPCHTQLAFPVSLKPWCAQLWLCPYLCLRLVSDPSGLPEGWFHLLVQKYKKSYKFQFCRRHKMPTSAQANHVLCLQRKLLSSCCLSEKGHHIAVSSPDISHKGLRSKRTQPSDPKALEGLPRPSSQRHEGPEFSFDLLPEARAIQVTIPPGPEVSVRLCHQWVLECEELSSPFDSQKTVSGGHAVELPYEFLLPCLCIEASYLQEDTVRRKKCPFRNWPEAYGSDFWKSVHFTDYSQHSQMVMALTLRCPLKLEASLCQRQGWHTICEDLPNATAQESEGWYVLESVDLHPQLCFKFSFGNSSHVECPHRTGEPLSDPGWDPLPPLNPYPTVTKPDWSPVLISLATTAQLLSPPANRMSPMMPFPTLAAPSWNVSMDTQAQQLVLHFSSRIHATFSAAWSHQSLGQDSLVRPVYSISQTQGSSPVTLDLIIPFLKPGSCVLVWRSDVQFSWKHLLCPDVSHRHLGLLILALLALATLLGIVLVFTRRRPLSGPGRARPVLLLHVADSEAQRRLVGALAELLRAALGGGRDVIVDLWEGTRVARVGPLPWLWAARARVAQERGTVLLLWSSAGPSPARGRDPHSAPLRALLRAAPRPLLLLAYFSRLCAKGDIPPPLRALPRYRLLRDLPRLLRALDARPSSEATGRGRLGDRPCLRGRVELCHRLEREAAKFCQPRLSRDRRRGTGWTP
ncbi:interleukin-17 receptor E isoform X3 [Callorhinus ursinus]|uniref:Interleukin-17 receptor E n=1 Tax=Callorhinus ursinus TaxID=34884 RepID=A0A3Q7Q4F6_CALUR|nr:interleukin-17 receptor E isoform X2 [Callorhinus ursinus]XP_025740723.1 interleukin-17 receptor E isoform X2 [Callorhinus ursinus]XP_025740724.1 interleukin-17 receptor E isoform X2 [Callorhinus ursinus]